MHDFKTENKVNLIFEYKQALHGDVIIEKIDKLPKEFDKLEKEPKDTLAYGEVTGHSHKLFRMSDLPVDGAAAFDLRVSPDGFRYLKVAEPVEVRHQEHDPRVIPPGIYRIGIQREYDPYTKLIRQVAD